MVTTIWKDIEDCAVPDPTAAGNGQVNRSLSDMPPVVFGNQIVVRKRIDYACSDRSSDDIGS